MEKALGTRLHTLVLVETERGFTDLTSCGIFADFTVVFARFTMSLEWESLNRAADHTVILR